MQFITARDLRNRSGEVWKQLKEARELVITSNGKPVAILSNFDEEDDLEQRLKDIRTARAARALDNMQQRAADKGLEKLNDEEIDNEVKMARQERR